MPPELPTYQFVPQNLINPNPRSDFKRIQFSAAGSEDEKSDLSVSDVPLDPAN